MTIFVSYLFVLTSHMLVRRKVITPRLVPQIYISYKGKILPFFVVGILCVHLLVLFIVKVSIHIFHAYKIKEKFKTHSCT